MQRVWKRIWEIRAEKRTWSSHEQARDAVLAICREQQIQPPSDDMLNYMAHALTRHTPT